MFPRNYSSLSEFSPALAAPNMGGISVISRRGRKEERKGKREGGGRKNGINPAWESVRSLGEGPF